MDADPDTRLDGFTRGRQSPTRSPTRSVLSSAPPDERVSPGTGFAGLSYASTPVLARSQARWSQAEDSPRREDEPAGARFAPIHLFHQRKHF